MTKEFVDVFHAIQPKASRSEAATYNARFGPSRCVTVPYAANFVRGQAHFSNIYYGASLAALCRLGKSKGYEFVGCNSAGNNAFFVRRDLAKGKFPELSVEAGYVKGKFREARDEWGRLTFAEDAAEQNILSSLPLVDVSNEYQHS